MDGPAAQVVLLCGPSGSGKSHVSRRCGLPVFHLDDFYRDVDDPELPASPELGIADWDDPRSWRGDEAVAALERLCREGRAEVPTYDMASSRSTGVAVITLDGASTVLAEGVFAAELVAPLSERGLLADAVVLNRGPWGNFVRRLVRDLAEHRGPPLALWRRGRLLMAAEPGMVEAACARGCRRVDATGLTELLVRAAGRRT